MEIIKKYGKFIALGGIALAIIGSFLAFATVSNAYVKESVNYITGDGKLILILMGIAVLVTIFNKMIPTLLLTSVSLGIVIYDAINVSKLFNVSSLANVSFGVGFYIVLIGLIITFIVSLLSILANRKK